MKKISFFLLLFLCTIKFSVAQTELRYEHYTIANGMSSNFTKVIEQDKYGFLWIGTIDGLNSFNGYNFTTYFSIDGDSTTLSDNSINDLLIDKNGTLWVATNKGLNKFITASNSFQRFFSGSDHKTNEALLINYIESDDKGNLWLGTDKGIRVLNTANNTIHTPEFKNDSLRKFVEAGIAGIYFDSHGSLWLGSSVRRGIRLADKKTLEPIAFNPVANKIPLAGIQVTGFLEDSKGLIWILTDEGLLSYSYQSNILMHYSRQEVPDESLPYSATSIIENDRGEIWVSLAANPPHYTSIAKVNSEAGTFKVYPYVDNDERGLAWSWVSFLYQDKSGIYWMGTSRGLDKMDPLCQQFKLYQQYTNLKYSQFNNIYCFVKDGDNLWLASDGKGLIKYQFSTNKFEQVFTTGEWSEVGLYYLLQMPDNNLLLGTADGVFQFNKATKNVTQLLGIPTPTGNSNSQVSCMIISPDGDLWIAFAGGGIIRYNLITKTQKSYRHDKNNKNSIGSDQSNILFFDKKGTLWIGSADGVNTFGGLPGNGLDRFNAADETFTHFVHDESDSTSLSNNNVVCMAEDNNGMLWVGTRNGGLNMFNPTTGKFKRYSKNEGMPSNFITAIQIDDSNNIWVSTFTNGMACLNPATGVIRVFDVAYGLQNIRFNRQATYKSSDGEIFFGGVSGFNSFHPAEIKFNTTAPTVLISGIKVNNAAYLTDSAVYDIKKMKLSYDQSELQFDFVAMNFSQSYKNQYAYQLVGYDKEWINAGTVRTAKYTSLNPGKYTFKVKACNNDGVWNETGTSISITITPPWWKTWWAYSIYIIVLACAVFGYVYYRSLKLKRENKVLEEKVELRTSQLKSSLENLKSTQSQLIQSEKMASLGELTAGIAHEIQNPLNFVNNFSEVNAELIDELNTEIQKGNLEEIKALARDIKENEQKINHHGKRADAIVKGMLQHSRKSSGVKEPTDINSLADEYLRLAYHGLRAKDKSFNAEMKTDYDNTIGNINVIPQEIGRVILNLITNAFYAVDERKKQIGETLLPDGQRYEPTVSVSTKNMGSTVEITVADNGNGIPQKIRDKIFQPFFTTKPSGQGTGLGLSLSYDIVKAHGGELRVETTENAGTTFTVLLPV